ncbi:hypothetical protein H4R33_006155 [Dimargaris cristalligena]|nr:hypothetical protein H4R33_006155 [Dimargaris cristalligena]
MQLPIIALVALGLPRVWSNPPFVDSSHKDPTFNCLATKADNTATHKQPDPIKPVNLRLQHTSDIIDQLHLYVAHEVRAIETPKPAELSPSKPVYGLYRLWNKFSHTDPLLAEIKRMLTTALSPGSRSHNLADTLPFLAPLEAVRLMRNGLMTLLPFLGFSSYGKETARHALWKPAETEDQEKYKKDIDIMGRDLWAMSSYIGRVPYSSLRPDQAAYLLPLHYAALHGQSGLVIQYLQELQATQWNFLSPELPPFAPPPLKTLTGWWTCSSKPVDLKPVAVDMAVSIAAHLIMHYQSLKLAQIAWFLKGVIQLQMDAPIREEINLRIVNIGVL